MKTKGTNNAYKFVNAQLEILNTFGQNHAHLEFVEDFTVDYETCQFCKGKGWRANNTCPDCKGNGINEVWRKQKCCETYECGCFLR